MLHNILPNSHVVGRAFSNSLVIIWNGFLYNRVLMLESVNDALVLYFVVHEPGIEQCPPCTCSCLVLALQGLKAGRSLWYWWPEHRLGPGSCCAVALALKPIFYDLGEFTGQRIFSLAFKRLGSHCGNSLYVLSGKRACDVFLGLGGCGWSGSRVVELTAIETVLMSYEDTQESLFSPRASSHTQFGSCSISPVIADVSIQWLEYLPLQGRLCGHQSPAPENPLEIIT